MTEERGSDKDVAQELINDPKFLFRLGKKIGELGVVHEKRNRLIVPLACLTTCVKNKVSLMLTGPSGCGKSTIPEVTLKLFPPEHVIKRVSFSQKALAYGEGSLGGKILYVAEYSGSKEAQHMLRVLQSEGQLSHEYTAGKKTEIAERLGSPVVLTTTTEETIFEDDSTRFLAIRASESPNKILAVLKGAIGNSTVPAEEPAPEVWQEAFRQLRLRAKKPFTFPDFLEFVAEELPRDDVRVQRDWKRCLAFLQAIALCRPQNSPTTKITFADYCVAYRILNLAFTATTHAVTENEISVQKAVKKLSNDGRRPVMIRHIRDELSWPDGLTYKYVRLAVKHALVKYEGGTHEKNIKRLLPTERVARDFLPSPQRVLERIGRNKGQTEYIDPLTGRVGRL
jgi:hypothetical protein